MDQTGWQFPAAAPYCGDVATIACRDARWTAPHPVVNGSVRHRDASIEGETMLGTLSRAPYHRQDSVRGSCEGASARPDESRDGVQGGVRRRARPVGDSPHAHEATPCVDQRVRRGFQGTILQEHWRRCFGGRTSGPCGSSGVRSMRSWRSAIAVGRIIKAVDCAAARRDAVRGASPLERRRPPHLPRGPAHECRRG
jgi:hypothetical protein